jgi:hypothetical protein
LIVVSRKLIVSLQEIMPNFAYRLRTKKIDYEEKEHFFLAAVASDGSANGSLWGKRQRRSARARPA